MTCLPDIDYYIRGFVSEGLPVFPLTPRDKRPATEHGVKDATLDPAKYGSLWDSGCNLGVACGRIDVVDCDSEGCLIAFASKVSGQTLTDKIRAADVLEHYLGPVVWTGKGGHVYVRHHAGRKNEARIIHLGDGWVDYRTAGGYVVAPPSIHPSGAKYHFHTRYFAPLAEAPEWIWNEREKTTSASQTVSAPTLPLVPSGETPERYFGVAMDANISRLASTPVGSRNHALNTAAFNIGQLVSTPEQEEVAMSRLHDVARAIGLGEHETVSTIRSGMTSGMASPKRPEPDQEVTITVGRMRPTEDGDIEVATATKKVKAKKIKLTDLTALILSTWPGLLAYDLFSHRIKKMRDQPGEPVSRHGEDRWEDVDQDTLAHNLSTILEEDVPTEKLTQAVSICAHRCEVQPVREYLARCREDWDGVSRIRDFLRAIGARETKAHRLEVAFWLAGAAARGYSSEPVKLDSMLILEGPQGIGKSSVVKILGGEWTMDTPLDLESKDAYVQLQGSWIIEWPELTSFVKSTPEKLKAFLSKTYDDFRMPYGRNTVRQIRQCAFIGTTNDSMYLKDSTGNRRFWPVKCDQGRVDFGWLRANRDQLWGEAMELMSAYEARGLGFVPAPGTEEDILAKQVETRQEMDELQDKLVAYVQDAWDHAWTRDGGLYLTLERVQSSPTFSSFRQKLLMEQMEKIGGKYSRRAPERATDFSTGAGKPVTKDRVRGMVFTSRPVYSDEYTDESFGEISIPTE